MTKPSKVVPPSASGVADDDSSTRVERDLLGERRIPIDALWGVHTLRAVENFAVTGEKVGDNPDLVVGLAMVKEAAVRANHELGRIDDLRAGAIIDACRELQQGYHHEHFVVDMIQGGAGTSTNMNANEVIANLALARLDRPLGDYGYLHPNEHVNASQSTNDVYPTALKLSCVFAARRLLSSMAHLRASFERKAQEFEAVIKIGRTQLQDAVPMTLGQEFSSYAVMMQEDEARLLDAMALLHEINLGATAVGTQVAAPIGYTEAVCVHLASITGLPVTTAANLVEATQDCGAFITFSGALKRTAVKLSKVCNDLRLLASGPRAGLREIQLPARQAGSSIMPGKVNPVIPEMVNQVAFEVIGNDLTVTMAAEAGQLQLNAFEPVIGFSCLKSVAHLDVAARKLADLCIDGITADAARLREAVDHSIGTVTVLNPHIGYAAATAIAGEALRSGRSVRELAAEMLDLEPDRLNDLFDPLTMANVRGPGSATWPAPADGV